MNLEEEGAWGALMLSQPHGPFWSFHRQSWSTAAGRCERGGWRNSLVLWEHLAWSTQVNSCWLADTFIPALIYATGADQELAHVCV